MVLVSSSFAQETLGPRIEITGVNPVVLPRVSVMVNAFDDFGQPLPNLVTENFRVVGDLAEHASVTEVVSFSDEKAVPISVVLAIDVSTSMAGTPITKAKEAASAFVSAMADDDPVAILTFSSRSSLIQDFTTRRDILLAIIDGLGYGGQTLLYDASLQAITHAAAIDNPRRAVILLSDGAHFDEFERSAVSREEAHRAAVVDGVPVYTIGLGFGPDRSYLTRLSEDTNAVFRESPTPAELNEIYTGLADLLRTQYDVTLEVDVPLDGRVWQLELEVDTPWGPVRSNGTLRAPVPVPIFSFPPVPVPVLEPFELVAEVTADDDVTGVMVTLDDEEPMRLAGPPYSILIDPVTLSPGPHSLQFSATDSDGDSGSATVDITVGALPPEVSIEPELAGEIEAAQTFTVTVGGQTSLAEAALRVDDGRSVTLDPRLSFIIDPNTLAPGEHILQLDVTNTGGESTTSGYPFTVPPLPILFEIVGLQEGELLEESAEVRVAVQSSQLPVTDIVYTLNDAPLADEDDQITLVAAELEPGAATLGVSVRNAGGQVETETLAFEVARLPLEIEVAGLSAGETIDSDVELTLNVIGQGSGFPVEALLDGEPILLQDGSATISILALQPGEHELEVRAQDDAGNISEASYPFSVSPGPAQTATRAVEERQATAAARAATAVEMNRARVAATIAARATGTQAETERIATVAAQATTTQVAMERRATSAARSATAVEMNRARVAATIAARATATQAETGRIATVAAQATTTQIAVERRATSAARSAAAVERNRARVTATVAARAIATQAANERIATAAAQAIATQVATQRIATAAAAAAQATSTQVAEQQVATAVAQATNTQVVAERRATATQVANERIATAVASAAQATATQVATQQIATAAAQATNTQVVAERRATSAARSAAAAERNRARITATRAARATATQVATERIATAAAQATATQVGHGTHRHGNVGGTGHGNSGCHATNRHGCRPGDEYTGRCGATRHFSRPLGRCRRTQPRPHNCYQGRTSHCHASRHRAHCHGCGTGDSYPGCHAAHCHGCGTGDGYPGRHATHRHGCRPGDGYPGCHATNRHGCRPGDEYTGRRRSHFSRPLGRCRTANCYQAHEPPQAIATQRIATAAAQATATQVATQRIATAAAQATATQVATQQIATATSAAQATATQVATQQIATALLPQATATQAATERIATATSAAQATATQVVVQQIATATSAAQATATQVATQRIATAVARVTEVAERNRARIAATVTARAQQSATRVADEATATQVAAEEIAIAAAQATASQVAVERSATTAARATSQAERNRARIAATLAARQLQTATQAVVERRATLDAVVDAASAINQQVRATDAARVTATELANLQATAEAASSTQAVLATQTGVVQATADSRATKSALAATEVVAMATFDAQVALDVIAVTERVREVRNAQATSTAQADIDATATTLAAELLAALATESALATEAAIASPTSSATPEPTATEAGATALPDTPVASITPGGTLVPAQAETTPAEGLITPVVVLCVALGLVGLLGLLLIFSLLRGVRRRGR